MKYLIPLLLAIVFTSSCQQGQHDHSHSHGHVHAQTYGDLDPKDYVATVVPDRIILNLTDDPAHSVAVNWRTQTSVTSSYIEWAVATHGPEFKENVSTIEAQTEIRSDKTLNAAFHSGIIYGLEPNKKYVYRVGDGGDNWSEWFQFETASDANDPFSFIYFGDAQNDIKSMWSRVIRESYATMPKVDFMLHAGDLINTYDSDPEWGEWFYAGGFIHAMVPSMMTPGNHEHKGENLSPQWEPQFNLPKNGPEGNQETIYYVDYQDMRVISLNSQWIFKNQKWKEEESKWLENVLASNPKKWTAVTMHHPLYNTRPGRDADELREVLKPIFDAYGVDIVLQGHDHAYGRGNNIPSGVSGADESGTMYVVSVSGPKMYEIDDLEWMDRKAQDTQLFQLITVHGDTLSYEAYTALGELYDAFDLVKDHDGPNHVIEKVPEMLERLRN